MNWMRFIGRRRLLPRTVHDVISRPRQRVVRLRERAWRLEISASAFIRVITRHWVRSGVAALVVLVLVIGLLRGVGRANIATLYATSCLGGWVNPQLAEGKPDVPPGSDAELFTAKNSAVLDGALSQLFCGGFKGDVPLGAAPKKVVLNLSWTVLGGEMQNTENRKQKTDNAGVQSVGTQNLASPSDEEPINIDISATAEQQVEALLDASEGQAVKVEEMAPPVEPAPVETLRATSQPIEPPAQPVEPPPPSPSIEPPAAETSRLPFIRAVMAQEAPIETVEALRSTSETTKPTDPVETQNFASPSDPPKLPKPDLIDKPIIPISEEKPLTDEPTSTSDSISVIPTSTQLLPADTEPPFLEISYTIDGKSWNSIAKVTSKSWQGLAVELPLQSWDELATAQIALQAVPTVAEQPQVLLDSAYLTVTYDTDAIEVQAQPDFSRDTIVQLLADGEINLVRVFSASKQHQQLWAYQTSGEGSWTLVAEEPDLDPLAASLLYSGTIVWITGGSSTIAMYQVSGGTFSSQTIEPKGSTDIDLSGGILARWDGTSLSLLDTNSGFIESAPAKSHAEFFVELRSSAVVAATATAPISSVSASNVSAEIKSAETEIFSPEPQNIIDPVSTSVPKKDGQLKHLPLEKSVIIIE